MLTWSMNAFCAEVRGSIGHFVAHVVLMAYCQGLGDVLEVVHCLCYFLEIAVLCLIPHAPKSSEWPTPEERYGNIIFLLATHYHTCIKVLLPSTTHPNGVQH